MSTIFVHQLARDLNRTEQEILDHLDALGVTASGAQARVALSMKQLVEARIREPEVRAPSSRGGDRGVPGETSVPTPTVWGELVDSDGAPQAVLVSYGEDESQRFLKEIAQTELTRGHGRQGGNIGDAVVEHLAKASPAILAGLQSGKVYQVIGTPALLRGLKSGSMTLMSTAEGALGTVLETSSGKIAGQLRFAQSSLAPVVAPFLALQILQGIAGTVHLAKIHTRLDTVQRSLERSSSRQEAATLGELRSALHVLNDILAEQRNTGTFSPDMLTRLALAEKSSRSIVERNKILVDGMQTRIRGVKQASGKSGAVAAATFLAEEAAQGDYDMRLLVATMLVTHRIEQARLLVAIEHSPTDVERRMKQIQQMVMEDRRTLECLPDFGEVKQHAVACVNEMSWFERSITARGVVRDVNGSSPVPPRIGNPDVLSDANETRGQYVFWQEPDGRRRIHILTKGDGNAND